MITYLMESSDEPPPSPVCDTTPDRVLLGAHHRGITWSRKVAAVWGVSSPFLGDRIRNHVAILEDTR